MLPKKKDKHISFRVDEELYNDANEEAQKYGGLSAVLRAFLRAIARGERNFDIDDVMQEHRRAPRRTPRRDQSKPWEE